ncbi:hypothetical protein HDV01_000876 [Terramyces sp. JEL0728]|nr:hypothetical protein HDV01_000876 [Terramyces sp. JEL0728]
MSLDCQNYYKNIRPALTGNPTVKTGDCCSDSGVICDNTNTGVVELHLQLSKLAGSIPPAIGSLTNLTYLYLNNNTLSGTIPPAIGNLVKLKELTLNDNQLTGALPAELANIKQLSSLTAARNKLQGPIPIAIQNMQYYTNFNLGDLSAAPTTTTSSSLGPSLASSPNASSNSNSSNSDSGPSSTPIIIGVIAAIVVVGMLLFGGFMYMRKKPSKELESQAQPKSRSQDPITLPNIENVGNLASLSRNLSSEKGHSIVTESTLHTTETYGARKTDNTMPPIAIPATSPSQNTMVSFARTETIEHPAQKPFEVQPPLMPNQKYNEGALTTGQYETPAQPPMLNSTVGELPIMPLVNTKPVQETYQPPIIQQSKPKTRRKVKDDLDFEDSDDEEKANTGTGALADFFNESRIEKRSRDTTPKTSQTNIGIINENERNEFMPPTMK